MLVVTKMQFTKFKVKHSSMQKGSQQEKKVNFFSLQTHKTLPLKIPGFSESERQYVISMS